MRKKREKGAGSKGPKCYCFTAARKEEG